MAHESAAKAYVLNLGEALHYELAAAGVLVTVMLPGNVDTPIIDAFGVDRAVMPIRRSRPSGQCGRPWRRSSPVDPCTFRVERCAS